MKRIALLISIILAGSPALSQRKSTILNKKYPFDMTFLDKYAGCLAANDTLIPISFNHKFSYLNAYTKAKLVNVEFDEAYPFFDQYAVVKENGKYGIINRKGDYVIKPLYNKFYPDYKNNVVSFDTDGRYFSVLSGKYVTLSEKQRGMIGYPAGPQMNNYKQANKYGVILRGNNRLPAIYDSVLCLGFRYEVLLKDGKIGVINDSGENILPFSYTDFFGYGFDYTYNSTFALKKDSTWYYYNAQYVGPLKKIFESSLRPIEINNNVIIFEINGLYNYMNNNGKIMLPKNYKWISPSGHVAVNEKDEVVLLNSKMEESVYYKD